MRDIKFRGKRVSDGEWVYGYYVYADVTKKHQIAVEVLDGCKHYYVYHEVIPETVGQYIGLKDKNNKEIYEGDICGDTHGQILQIVWNECHQWGCTVISSSAIKGLTFPLWQWDIARNPYYPTLEVIGNIYDNPELLEEAKQ
ncbi:YopX family protein [Dehalococcoides mccartyi]|uniref:YopX family protein n=1 Tax=Dehalococcoides mccartyi TaxID=61435 RepID=UPI0026ED0A11|nr:YopX family protein [Dehalococcoides mccartyi]